MLFHNPLVSFTYLKSGHLITIFQFYNSLPEANLNLMLDIAWEECMYLRGNSLRFHISPHDHCTMMCQLPFLTPSPKPICFMKLPEEKPL